MGIQTKSGVIYGKVGSVIYRRWRGLNIVQGVPRQVKQSIASQAAAAEFGRASATAANIRKSLIRFYQQADEGMNNRLTRTVLRALQHSEGKERLERDIHDADLAHLNGFQFNSNSPLQEALPVIPEVSIQSNGTASIIIPGFKAEEIRYTGEKKGRKDYRLRIVAIAYDFRNSFAEVIDVQETTIEEEQPEITWNLAEEIPQGRILLVGIALYAQQHTGDETVLLNSPAWSPAAIVGITQVQNELEQQESYADRVNYHRDQQLNGKLIWLPYTCKKDLNGWLWKKYEIYLKQLRQCSRQKKNGFTLEKGWIALT